MSNNTSEKIPRSPSQKKDTPFNRNEVNQILQSNEKPDNFGYLRELLLKKPSIRNFGVILNLLNQYDVESSEFKMTYEYAQSHLANWPDESRAYLNESTESTVIIEDVKSGVMKPEVIKLLRFVRISSGEIYKDYQEIIKLIPNISYINVNVGNAENITEDFIKIQKELSPQIKSQFLHLSVNPDRLLEALHSIVDPKTVSILSITSNKTQDKINLNLEVFDQLGALSINSVNINKLTLPKNHLTFFALITSNINTLDLTDQPLLERLNIQYNSLSEIQGVNKLNSIKAHMLIGNDNLDNEKVSEELESIKKQNELGAGS